MVAIDGTIHLIGRLVFVSLNQAFALNLAPGALLNLWQFDLFPSDLRPLLMLVKHRLQVLNQYVTVVLFCVGLCHGRIRRRTWDLDLHKGVH